MHEISNQGLFMNNRLKWGVILVTITLIVTVSLYARRHRDTTDAQQATRIVLANYVADHNMWSYDAYLHMRTIEDGPLSDTNFGWMMNWLTSKPQDKADPALYDSMILAELMDTKLTKSEIATASDAVLPLMNVEDPKDKDGVIEAWSCNFFRVYPSRAAVPHLLLLLNSPHKWVRRQSALALSASGYKVNIPSRPSSW